MVYVLVFSRQIFFTTAPTFRYFTGRENITTYFFFVASKEQTYYPAVCSLDTAGCWQENKIYQNIKGKRTTAETILDRMQHERICTTNFRLCVEEIHLPDESADGQLALGMTGGRTLSSNKGRPPPMLGLRWGIDALDEACDGSTCSCANCFSNLASSSSSWAISRRYTRFCTSTRYWSSLSPQQILSRLDYLQTISWLQDSIAKATSNQGILFFLILQVG